MINFWVSKPRVKGPGSAPGVRLFGTFFPADTRMRDMSQGMAHIHLKCLGKPSVLVIKRS